MYKALKTAQSEIQEALLKFVDESSSSNVTKCPRGEPCQCALITQSRETAVNDAGFKFPSAEFNQRFEGIEESLQFLHNKQNRQFETLVEEMQSLNRNVSSVVKLLMEQTKPTVDAVSTIPNLQPMAEDSDLKNVCVTGGMTEDISEIQGEDTPEIDEEEEDAVSVPDEAFVPEEEVASVPEEEEEEGIELEEWTYKGRKFFKDSENTVYENNDGEPGDQIGLYDPVKNIVKKLPTN